MPSHYRIPSYANVAHAFGVALGEISAIIDTIICLDQRKKFLEELKAKILEQAGDHARLIDMQMIPYHYMPGNKARVILMAGK